MNLPTKQLSIVASSKKRAHGKLQKDVQVSEYGHNRICQYSRHVAACIICMHCMCALRYCLQYVYIHA